MGSTRPPGLIGEVLKAEFAMRTETHQIDRNIVGEAIDQHQVGLDMAVAVIFPVPGQGVVVMSLLQGLVGHQLRDHLDKVGIEGFPMSPLLFTLVVSLELTGAANRPHSDPPSDL